MLRTVVVAVGLVLLNGCATNQSDVGVSQISSYAGEPFPVRLVNRAKFDKRFLPTEVPNATGAPAGTIVIDTASNYLYWVETSQTARRYGIAVGAAGYDWHGEATIERKAKWPVWYPTDDMHAQVPGLPRRIEAGTQNPLGARALYLYANGKDTLYRIHGTSEPWTIGTKASSGCIRMFNEDVIELFDKVETGTKVIVM
ncbi:L,D-transpeptidase [Mesorhizobium sp. DCY119]|uniref:L,D-transpeptidase n=1 Tax=Mesorhizobium sp. DCY119 TaxID=2108445 RepID=UPI000E715EDB|nr:L,D-transpeptidase [Mesorhizobium sp. DCY119]RJG40621.1 L,D-transpeptidase [Mesorhizobium sp. DCY119]